VFTTTQLSRYAAGTHMAGMLVKTQLVFRQIIFNFHYRSSNPYEAPFRFRTLVCRLSLLPVLLNRDLLLTISVAHRLPAIVAHSLLQCRNMPDKRDAAEGTDSAFGR